MNVTHTKLQSFLDNVLAVLVVYKRHASQVETFISLRYALEKQHCLFDLFIYDNSPFPMKGSLSSEEPWRIHYHHDPLNPGVSKAYNEGFKLARHLGKKWLLFLDQDTVFPENALAVYTEALEQYPNMGIFVPILKADSKTCSPCRYLFRTGFHLHSISPGVHQFIGKAILNSGMLVRTEVFEQCGGYDERIKVDFADFAFNNRLRRCCDSFYLLPLQCDHGFSGSEKGTLDAALDRFALFRQGATASSATVADSILYGLVVFKRALRLTLRFRSFCFLKTCFGRKCEKHPG